MKTVRLKSLTLINFKGIKELTIEFRDKTDIFGANATGKTTIFDAFIWLFFGKDSTDRKDFSIKTLDINNTPAHKLDHEVIGVLIVDDQEITLKRTFREKWVKKRGSEETEFTGNETLFYFNDVPCQAGEYQKKINSIIDENIFKLITNPVYFNQLSWQDRRNVLIQIAGKISDDDLYNSKAEFKELAAYLSNKTLEEFKREIAAKKKKIKDDLQAIPTRIDEIHRGIPEAPNYSALQSEIEALQKQLTDIESKIADSSLVSQSIVEAKQKKQQEIYYLKGKLQEMEFSYNTRINSATNECQSKIFDLNQKISNTDREKINHSNLIASNSTRINELNETVITLRNKWNEENERTLVYDEHKFTCPTCKRQYETDNVEAMKAEMEANFNRDKLQKLNDISVKGKTLNAEITKLKGENEKTQSLIESIDSKLADLNLELKTVLIEETSPIEDISCSADYTDLKGKIIDLEIILNSENIPTPDATDLSKERVSLVSQIDNLKTKLSVRSIIDKANTRVKELSEEEKNLAQQLSNLEKREFIIADFTKSKIDMLEKKINSMFNYVKFKMFETQINGGEVESCTCLIDGVPWQDANNAAKINSGIDIIRTLSAYYQVSAPVIVDNAEAVNELISIDSQVIRLIVTNDSQLIIA